MPSQSLPDRSARPAVRSSLIFSAIGLAAFAVALVVKLPAAVVIDRDDSILARAGTIWKGEAALAGGDRLSWRWAPLRSLASLGFAADFQITGPETDLAGRAVIGSDSATVDSVTGRAGGSLIEAVAPYLPFRCAAPLQIDIPQASDARIEGEVRSGAGSCASKAGGVATAIPALLLTARAVGEETLVTAAPTGQPRRQLITATLGRDRRLMLRVTPEGARVLPFTVPPGSAGLTVETSL